jgi:DUF1680 family protein
VLYNGLISGVSLKGDSFFYPNPLESQGSYTRRPWFGCACCPVNITRFLPSLPGYIYATKGKSVYINLYIGNQARIPLEDQEIGIEQLTGYPWSGKVTIRLHPSGKEKFDLLLRIPGWSVGNAFPTDLYTFKEMNRGQVTISINGTNTPVSLNEGYAVISRKWNDGDEVVLDLPMEILEVKANPKVIADTGRVALQHGPIVYCAEQIDQPFNGLSQIIIDGHSQLSYIPTPADPGGIRAIEGKTEVIITNENGKKTLAEESFRAIPYYAWANRAKGEMRVWFSDSNKLFPEDSR